MKNNLKKLQRLVIRNFFVNPNEVHGRASFQKDLKFTENEFVALLAYAENAFRMEIADQEIPKLKTVSDIVRYIEKQQKK